MQADLCKSLKPKGVMEEGGGGERAEMDLLAAVGVGRGNG